MEREERHIWAKVRCWSTLTLEQAEFLKRLDVLRGYVRMPDWIFITTLCWLCGEHLSANETDHWRCRLAEGRTSHGPYCRGHHPEIARRLKG